jgi:hypothetical protein
MKKVMLQLIMAAVFLVIGAPQVFAAVGELQLPSISQINHNNYSYGYTFLNDQENLLVADGYTLKVVKASQGTTVQSFATNSISYFTANDSNSYFVTSSYDYMDIFDNFGEKLFHKREIAYKDAVFSDFDNLEFIPNTNILVMITNNSTKLVGFDVEKQQVVFYRNISEGSGMTLSSQFIAVSGSEKSVNIYDINGEYVDTIQSDMNIRTMKFTADGKKLVLGGDDDQLSIYDVNQDFMKINLPSTQFKSYSGWMFDYIDIDKSGKYLVAITKASSYYSDSSFIMFDFKTGQRIYTNLDNLDYVGNTDISSDGKYVLVDGNVYNGKNLVKRVTKVSIPTKYLKLQLGSKTDLSLQGTLADGTASEIKSGITWATSDFSVAYLSSGKLVAQKIGTFDLKAKYLGFEVKNKVQVIDTIAPAFKGISNISVPLWQPFNSRSGVTSYDMGSGDLTKSIKVTGSVNVNKEGKYTLIYTSVDKAKNTKKVKRFIIVKKMLASNFYTYKAKNGTKFYVHRGVFTDKGNPRYNRTFAPYIFNSPKKGNLMFEVDAALSSSIYMDKIIITAGKKTYTKYLYSDLEYHYRHETYYFSPNKSLIDFLKKNVTLKQSVKVKFNGYYGSVSYTLNTNQKAAIIDTLKYGGY